MSVRRTSRRYLRNAVDASRELQEFLDENPAVASGLATVGNLLVNAMMQSKYGPVVQQLLNPGAKTNGTTAAGAAETAAPAATRAKSATAKPAGKAKRSPGRVAKKTVKAAKATKAGK